MACSYLELVKAFPLASIRSDEHLTEAQKVMDRLLARGTPDDGETMYLNALSDLVTVYEDAHHGSTLRNPLPNPHSHDAWYRKWGHPSRGRGFCPGIVAVFCVR